MKTNQSTFSGAAALSEFISMKDNCRVLLSKIDSHLAANMGADLDDINWRHVGDISHIEELLENICEFSGNENQTL